jgi:hypothetical protein
VNQLIEHVVLGRFHLSGNRVYRDLAAQYWNSLCRGRTVLRMRPDEAREEIISGIDYAAYKETDSSLHDAEKNRLFGSEHYKSGRPVYKPSPWAEGDFEDKMATLLRIANALNRSVPTFREAQRLLENEESVLGRVVRQANRPQP